MQIIPTILTDSLEKVQEKQKKYHEIFEWVQLDIIDGVFVDNKTLLPDQFPNLPGFKIDVHLMVNNPLSLLADCQKLKAQRVIGQIEMMPDQLEFVQKTKASFSQVGLALDLDTALDKLETDLLRQLDVILLMSIKAGWGGQKFSPGVLEKIKELVKIKKEKNLAFQIALDGGINEETIRQPYKLGAEIFYVGNYLLDNPERKLAALQKAVL